LCTWGGAGSGSDRIADEVNSFASRLLVRHRYGCFE
jgi:hypothetical protein